MSIEAYEVVAYRKAADAFRKTLDEELSAIDSLAGLLNTEHVHTGAIVDKATGRSMLVKTTITFGDRFMTEAEVRLVQAAHDRARGRVPRT